MSENGISFSSEQELMASVSGEKGKVTIPGVDEAGRGPLAGPVVAAAVVFPQEWIEAGSLKLSELHGLNDSKRLTSARREQLFETITGTGSIHWSIGVSDVEEIDKLNILGATRLAMKRAVDGLSVSRVMALVDGLPLSPSPFPHRSLVKGDSLSWSIAAASVVAKVHRDRLMLEMDAAFPGYGFASHKGYGTKAHLEAIEKLGPTPHHRMSFAPLRKDQLELF